MTSYTRQIAPFSSLLLIKCNPSNINHHGIYSDLHMYLLIYLVLCDLHILTQLTLS